MTKYTLQQILLFISEVPFHSDNYWGTEVIYSEGVVESTCGSYFDYINSREAATALIDDYVKHLGRTWEG